MPNNYIARITDKGAGIEYVHPTNIHITIRVMPGKPHSPLSHQQKPYVVHKVDKGALDKYGNIVNKQFPEAHIPTKEFIYKE